MFMTAARQMALSLFKKNPVLQAALMSGAAGSLLYCLQAGAAHLFRSCISTRLYSSIEISSGEKDYYDAVVDFIQDQRLLRNANHLTACSIGSAAVSFDDRLEDVCYQPADTGPPVSMVYTGRTVYAARRCGETLTVGRSVVRLETLTLSVFGPDPTIIKALVSDAVDRVNRMREGMVRVFAFSNEWPHGWACVLSKLPRSLDSVVLDNTILRDTIDDVREFLASGPWYERMGIPYRRGYLLHGPPGCGKTSFCQVLAGVLKLDICCLSVSNKNVSDTLLMTRLRDAPLRSIVLLEDVDSVFVLRDAAAASDDSSRVTFSGLINAIDGVASQEGRIFVMTTNYVNMLDPALIRPGRCDVKLFFGNASSEQLGAMFLRFFPGCEDCARRFVGLVPAGKMSLAQIQCHLVEHRHSAEQAVEQAHRLLLPDNACAVGCGQTQPCTVNNPC
jgi:chaperone BCS1